MPRLLQAFVLAACALLVSVPAGASANLVPDAPLRKRPKETTEQALYRHGVRCMDVIEREKCAIDYFERLLAEDPRERALAGDAVLRLVALYRGQGREDEAKDLLRDFWDIGMGGRRGKRVVPYSTRFLPEDMTMLLYVDVASTRKARVFDRLPADAKDLIFTCDEARRETLEKEQKARRERKRAEREAREQEKKKTAAKSKPDQGKQKGEGKSGKKTNKKSKSGRGDRDGDKDREESIMEDGLCQLARALGHDDLRQWTGFLAAQNHNHPRLSALVARVPKAKETVRAAVNRGMLTPHSDRRWRIPGQTFAGEPVDVYNLDGNELVVASASQLDRIVRARKGRKKTLDKELKTLVRRVPEDVSFFTVMTKRAMQDQMRELGALASFLPAPDGMLMSAVAYDYAGVFVQIPTSDPLRAAVLLSIVRNMLESEEKKQESDGEERSVRARDMDVSRTRDGKALQMSLVLDHAQVRRMFMD